MWRFLILETNITLNYAKSKGGDLFSNSNVHKFNVQNSIVTQNVAVNYGGGFFITSSNLASTPYVLDQVEFRNNSANSFSGGALYSDLPLEISNCLFSFNYASQSGGAVSAFGATKMIYSSDFTANRAGSKGGAISAEGHLDIPIACLHLPNPSEVISIRYAILTHSWEI